MDIKEAKKSLQDLSIFLAYNTSIDVLISDNDHISHIFAGTGVMDPNSNPREIQSKEDLLQGLLYSMNKGKSIELTIEKVRIKKWLEREIESENTRMGGQAGIMTNILSSLGCKTIVYTKPLSEEQANKFYENNNIHFPTIEKNELNLKHPKEVAEETETPRHYVFEFEEDQKLKGVTAKRDSRFIAYPVSENENLEIGDLEEHLEELVKKIDVTILSGFHKLKKEYSDGTDWKEHMESSRNLIKRIKDLNPDINIQIELNYFSDKEKRKYLVKKILPEIDSISLDLEELKQVIRDIETIEIKEDLDDEEDIEDIYKSMKAVFKELNLKRLNLHTMNFYMSLIEDYLPPEQVKESLKSAKKICYEEAEQGNLKSEKENIKSKDKINESEKGIEARRKLSKFLESKKFKRTGIFRGSPDLVFVTNEKLKNLEFAVGLGDAVSDTSFALQNSIQKAKSNSLPGNESK